MKRDDPATVTDADVAGGEDGEGLSDFDLEDLEAEAEDRCCDDRRYNKWDSTSWCGCQR